MLPIRCRTSYRAPSDVKTKDAAVQTTAGSEAALISVRSTGAGRSCRHRAAPIRFALPTLLSSVLQTALAEQSQLRKHREYEKPLASPATNVPRDRRSSRECLGLQCQAHWSKSRRAFLQQASAALRTQRTLGRKPKAQVRHFDRPCHLHSEEPLRGKRILPAPCTREASRANDHAARSTTAAQQH